MLILGIEIIGGMLIGGLTSVTTYRTLKKPSAPVIEIDDIFDDDPDDE